MDLWHNSKGRSKVCSMRTLLQNTCIRSSMISIQHEPHLRPGLPLCWMKRQGCLIAAEVAAEGANASEDGGCGLTRQLNGRAAAAVARARKTDVEGAADARNSRETAEVMLRRAMLVSHLFPEIIFSYASMRVCFGRLEIDFQGGQFCLRDIYSLSC